VTRDPLFDVTHREAALNLVIKPTPYQPLRRTIFHRKFGAAEMYTIDARHAISTFPYEWRADPWPTAD